MTSDIHDHLSVLDTMFILAEERIADLRASDALGRRPITLGGSLVTDEGLRQRALNR